jgi:hypothetical protein
METEQKVDRAREQAAAQADNITAMMQRLDHATAGFLRHGQRCDWYDNPGSCDAVLGAATTEEIRLFGEGEVHVELELDLIDPDGHHRLRRRLRLREYHNVESAQEDIDQSPLSVEVRSDWQPPGVPNGEARPLEAVEFRITLCSNFRAGLAMFQTGGPAVQIRGDIDIEGNPLSAWLEYQDWGTPWKKYTDYHRPGLSDAIIEYSRYFISPEGEDALSRGR